MFDFYLEYEYWFAAVQLALAMMGMGATLRISDFARVFLQPRPLVVGLGVQMVLVPLMAWGLILVGQPEAGMAVGLALVAAIPGGTMSNVFTFLARGHVALSIAITAITTLACLVTTPVLLGLLIAEHVPPDFVMPAGRMAVEIALILLLPLVLGMVFLQFFPTRGPAFAKWCIRGSVFCIILIVIGATGADRINPDSLSRAEVVMLGALIAMFAVLSWVVPRLLGLASPDTTAINIEVTLRNGNLGLLIKASLFPAAVGVADPVGDKVLVVVLLYGGVAMLISTVQIALHGFANKRLQHAAADGA